MFLSLGVIVGCVQLAVRRVEAGQHGHHGPPADKLWVFPWQIYPDMVVFDWLIRLSEKDRMVGCDLTYGIETNTGKGSAGNTSIVENFLPSYRTFKIYPLESNTTYWLYMTCKDKEGGWHLSDTINFTTSVATLYEDQAAAIQTDGVGQNTFKERFNRGMLSVRPTGRFSPHVLMGLSCVVLSVLVLSVSTLLLARRYKQGKTYQIEIEKEIKAFEEGEHGICEEDLIRSNINIRSNEQYVDIDDSIHDDITINSEDEANDQDTVEEDDSSKF